MSTSVDGGQLRALVERIERMEEQKADIAGDIKEIYAEAKSSGYDTKILRKVISLRKLDRDTRQEQEAILELYMNALGMLADTPLGRAAMDRDIGSTTVSLSYRDDDGSTKSTPSMPLRDLSRKMASA